MAEENLARQAELALERQGDYDSLFYEGRWHSAARSPSARPGSRPG